MQVQKKIKIKINAQMNKRTDYANYHTFGESDICAFIFLFLFLFYLSNITSVCKCSVLPLDFGTVPTMG